MRSLRPIIITTLFWETFFLLILLYYSIKKQEKTKAKLTRLLLDGLLDCYLFINDYYTKVLIHLVCMQNFLKNFLCTSGGNVNFLVKFAYVLNEWSQGDLDSFKRSSLHLSKLFPIPLFGLWRNKANNCKILINIL